MKEKILTIVVISICMVSIVWFVFNLSDYLMKQDRANYIKQNTSQTLILYSGGKEVRRWESTGYITEISNGFQFNTKDGEVRGNGTYVIE